MQHTLLPVAMEAQTPVDINPQFAASVTDRIWQDAILHFSFTGNELLLPISITTTIGMMNVERLKAQLRLVFFSSSSSSSYSFFLVDEEAC